MPPHSPFRTPHSAFRIPHSLRAFTLMEIMIVVGIMGIILTMGVPIVYKVWRQVPMRKAVSDVVEVCSHARARAIMQGAMTEVVFHPQANRLEMAGAGSPPSPAAGEEGRPPAPTPAPASGSGLSAQLAEGIIIELLAINMSGVEYEKAEEARIRFYPNGVADEMRMILFDGRERMGLETEITTGLIHVVPNPLREWSRR